jgi:D-galactarolactone cycloisomerase|tara:strand:- start:249 stop:1334 length:1086 start_codon:yes stop_codon:yes gene_type:complete
MKIIKIKSIVIKKKLKIPRKNSFGIQNFRSGFFVKLIDNMGKTGYGEGFCNWPSFSASYRNKYIKNIFEPLIKKYEFNHPIKLYNYLKENTKKIKIQSGDIGPINHCIAAIDIAAWDLYAKIKGKTLRDILYKNPKSSIPLYASGLTINNFHKFYPKIKKFKLNNIKIKVGFKEEEDIEFLRLISKLNFKSVMIDANQAWKYNEAIKRILNLEKITKLYWVEEPIIASSSVNKWKSLRKNISTNIAAGENHYGSADVKKYIKSKCFDFYQPDITKYGGISSFIEIYKDCKKDIKFLTPHYLGSGLGLFASANLISGISNIPMEFDITENEIRDEIFKKNLKIHQGKLILNKKPGIGINLNF